MMKETNSRAAMRQHLDKLHRDAIDDADRVFKDVRDLGALSASVSADTFRRLVRTVKITLSTRMTASAGRYYHNRNEIRLSVPLLQSRPDQLRDTFYHELAHGTAGPGAAHGTLWKIHAVAWGAEPVRCHTITPAHYKNRPEAICTKCGNTARLGPIRAKRLAAYGTGYYRHNQCGGNYALKHTDPVVQRDSEARPLRDRKLPESDQQCTRCRRAKPASEFYKDRSSKSGYMSWCKTCLKEHRNSKERQS